jgi:hypothetical protein
MYKTIILPLAKEDIREAAKWYNKQQGGKYSHLSDYI